MHKKMKFIMANALLCILSTSIFSTNLSVSAVESFAPDSVLMSNEVIDLSNNITENEKTLESLDLEINETNGNLETIVKDLTDIKKTFQNKKSLLSINQKDKYNNLKIFELVLKSGNISDLMNNLKLTKSLMVVQSQSLKKINDKEEILISEYSSLSNKVESLNESKEQLSEAQLELRDKLKKIEDEIAKLENLNSITVSNIVYNPNNLLQPSNIDVDTLRYLLKDTKLSELAPTYVQLEKDYGINALFIVGISALESGWGTSKRAIEDNNLTGFGVYHDDSVGLNTATKTDNLIMTAKTLKKNYLSINGSLYTGVTIHDVNAKYCIGYNGLPDFNWSLTINDIVEKLLNKL